MKKLLLILGIVFSLMMSGCQTTSTIPKPLVGKKEVRKRSFSAVRFLERYSEVETIMNQADQNYILNHEPQSQRQNSSAMEAALILGLSKYVIAQSSDSQPLSFEAMLREKSILLESAIQNNIYLHTDNILKQVSQAIQISRNSDGFGQYHLSLIEAQLMNIQPSIEPVEYSEMDNSLNVAEGESGEETHPVILKAQQLAEENKLKEAIGIIKTLPVSSPHYKEAQANIVRMASNAVKQLRQKAAMAFQNAHPLNDGEQKTQYLLEAKTYLEDALNNFPEAPSDQLSGIRQNLAVIEQDLLQNHSESD